MSPGRLSGGFAPAGLCANCRHAHVTPHPRGGMDYWRCGRAGTDPAYPKYPRLPVLQCKGHEPGEPAT